MDSTHLIRRIGSAALRGKTEEEVRRLAEAEARLLVAELRQEGEEEQARKLLSLVDEISLVAMTSWKICQ